MLWWSTWLFGWYRNLGLRFYVSGFILISQYTTSFHQKEGSCWDHNRCQSRYSNPRLLSLISLGLFLLHFNLAFSVIIFYLTLLRHFQSSPFNWPSKARIKSLFLSMIVLSMNNSNPLAFSLFLWQTYKFHILFFSINDENHISFMYFIIMFICNIIMRKKW